MVKFRKTKTKTTATATDTTATDLDSLMKIFAAGVAAIQAGKTIQEAMEDGYVGLDDKPKGFIIYKTENHTGQVFFSDHHPVDGIDTFGHSTKKKDRFVEEGFKYDTYQDAFENLVDLLSRDWTELNNDTIVSLGIYDVEADKSVFSLIVNNPHNGADCVSLF